MASTVSLRGTVIMTLGVSCSYRLSGANLHLSTSAPQQVDPEDADDTENSAPSPSLQDGEPTSARLVGTSQCSDWPNSHDHKNLENASPMPSTPPSDVSLSSSDSSQGPFPDNPSACPGSGGTYGNYLSHCVRARFTTLTTM